MIGNKDLFLGLGISILAFTLSFLLVLGIRRWAENRHILDVPNSRRSNTHPIARGGGLAIVIVTLMFSGVLWVVNPHWTIFESIVLVIGGLIVAGISGWDDLHPLPYWIRFAVHIAVAGLIIIGIGYWQILQLPFIGKFSIGLLGLPVTLLWIVGLINAYNFMDGIDGIAGGQGVIAGLGWAFFGWISGQFIIAGIGLVLVASCLGFLGHNWPPARIFMGDVGSAFLGYTFAVLPIVTVQQDPRLAIAGVLLVWPFVFDTLFTFFCRLFRHENVFTAHRTHLYQRLVDTGYSHKKVASLYIGLAIIGLVCSIALVMDWPWGDYLTGIIIAAPLFLWLETRRRERDFLQITDLR
jgi:UDP-N-acetylmuramyl pentapeptide phosphotransferase/UDP-N-acetylglucosamine-1-phosphate transferase